MSICAEEMDRIPPPPHTQIYTQFHKFIWITKIIILFNTYLQHNHHKINNTQTKTSNYILSVKFTYDVINALVTSCCCQQKWQILTTMWLFTHVCNVNNASIIIGKLSQEEIIIIKATWAITANLKTSITSVINRNKVIGSNSKQQWQRR